MHVITVYKTCIGSQPCFIMQRCIRELKQISVITCHPRWSNRFNDLFGQPLMGADVSLLHIFWPLTQTKSTSVQRKVRHALCPIVNKGVEHVTTSVFWYMSQCIEMEKRQDGCPGRHWRRWRQASTYLLRDNDTSQPDDLSISRCDTSDCYITWLGDCFVNSSTGNKRKWILIRIKVSLRKIHLDMLAIDAVLSMLSQIFLDRKRGDPTDDKFKTWGLVPKQESQAGISNCITQYSVRC